MSHVASSSNAALASHATVGFKSLLERVVAEVAEAHDKEVEALRQRLDSLRPQEPSHDCQNARASLVLQEFGEAPCALMEPLGAPKPTRSKDPCDLDQSFASILPGTPTDNEHLKVAPPRRRSNERSPSPSPDRWKRATNRVAVGLQFRSACGGHAAPSPRAGRVRAHSALKEAKEMGLLFNARSSHESNIVSALSSDETFEPSKMPKWQWMHRTGWRDYKEEEMEQLEKSFQGGESKSRLKSGKQGHHPMEIFFADMIQHDAASRKVRSVRRVGPNPWWQRLRRFCRSVWRSLETGTRRMESFEQFYGDDGGRRRVSVKDSSNEHASDDFKPTLSLRGNDDHFETERKRWRTHGCKRIADSTIFIWVMMSTVVMNVIWILIETDLNDAGTLYDADLIFQVVENVFCIVFTIEMTVRFLSFARKCDAIFDRWFVFDSLCTVSMIIEIWLIPLFLLLVQGQQGVANYPWATLRLVRLLRVTRIGRLVRMVPDLITLLKGLYCSLRPVVVSTILLSIVILLFAVVIRSEVKGTWLGECCWLEEGCSRCDGLFHSIPDTVLTLLFNGTLLDNVKDVVDAIKYESTFLMVVFTLYVFITNCAILNMLIGILCGVVADVKKTETERTDKYRLMSRLSDIMEVYDKDANSKLDKEEFDLFITNPEVKHVLAEFQVDVWGLRTFMNTYSASLSEDSLEDNEGDASFRFDEILDIVLRMRGGGGASVSDIVNLRRFTGQRMDNVESLVQELSHREAGWLK